MIGQRVVVAVLLGAFAAAGCSKKPVEEPAPQVEQDNDAAARAEAERLERERLERERLEAERLERERMAELERARAMLGDRIHFNYDEASIMPEAQDKLAQKVPLLRQNQDIRMRIEGHADERGSIEYNLALGLRRANAAKDFLVNYGLEGSRFEVVSFGEERPLVEGSTESAFAQNRRAEFVVTSGSVR